MSHYPLLNPHVLNSIPNDLDDRSILDVGCGFGEWGFLIRTRKSGFPFLIGLDVWRSHLTMLGKLTVYDELVCNKIPPIPLKDKSVDISLCCEILEHLPRKSGLDLLDELERVTKELIIVSVPLNWPQEETYGNIYERHVSKWLPRDLAQLGYETKVIYALAKPLAFIDGIIDGIRRAIFRLPPTPKFIVARKFPTAQTPSKDRRN